MKTLIALRGAGNRGKSRTLCMLIELIKVAYPSAKFEEKRYKIDITVVITVGTIKVGVETQGDPNSRLERSLNTFVDIGCKVIVCASRSSGRTVEIVNEAGSRGYRVKWVEKASVQESAMQCAANRASAGELLTLVQAAIDA
ncbi:MAG: hypothetical protein NW204_10880 [Xanthomonadaceae bacterium]|nr:hypothetical protein [Xanthomonadaceae bacterium]